MRPVWRVPALGAVSAGVLLLTSGCISLLPETEPAQLYRLASVDGASSVMAENAEPLIVDRIAAPRGLAGDRVALVRDGQIAYMAGAAWLSPAPALLHGALLDTFHAEAPYLAPARSEDGVNARYRLQLELRRFEAEYDQGDRAAPLVQVSLMARLIDRDNRRLLAARRIAASQRATANRQSDIIAAFSTASQAAARDLASWTADQVCDGEDAPEACR
jgi:cholesterol transport system auxiliary component